MRLSRPPQSPTPGHQAAGGTTGATARRFLCGVLLSLSLLVVGPLAACGTQEGQGGIPTQTVQPPGGETTGAGSQTPSPTASPTAATPSPTQDASPSPTGSPGGGGNAQAGRQIFASTCATCHGNEGQGGIGPDLQPLEEGDLALIRRKVTNGGGGMPSFKDRLSAQQIDDVSAYVPTL